MSVLETFYFLFDADASKAKAEMLGAQEAADDLAEAVEQVGDVDASGVKKVADALEDAGDKSQVAARNAQGLASSFLGVAAALAAPILSAFSVGALGAFVDQRAADLTRLDQVATKLRTSVGDVDAFRRAVIAAGGSSEGAIDSLTKLAEKVGEAAAEAGGGAAKDFASWGVKLKDAKGQAVSTSEGMLRLADSLAKVGKAEAAGRLKKLGIEDPATIELLMKGRKELEERVKLEKELGVVTERQIELARQYRSEQGRLGNVLEMIGNRISEIIMPAITDGIRRVTQAFTWMAKNEKLVTGFFVAIAGIVTAVYLPAVVRATLATYALLAPYILLIAAVALVAAAFALAYEDVMAFLDGQPSLIGEMIKKYPALGEAIRAVGDILERAAGIFETVASAARTAFDTVLTVIGKVAEGVKGYFQNLLESYRPLIDAIANAGKLVADIAAAVRDKWGGVLANLPAPWAAAFKAIFGDAEGFKAKMADVGILIAQGFEAAANVVARVWNATIGRIAGGINAVVDGVRSLLRLGGEAPAMPPGATGPEKPGASLPPVSDGMPTFSDGPVVGKQSAVTARQSMQTADASAFNSQPAGAAAREAAGPVSQDNSTTVDIGTVTIKTAATDAAGIARDIRKELASVIRQTQGNLDDGVAA